jgi:hypothetical protein
MVSLTRALPFITMAVLIACQNDSVGPDAGPSAASRLAKGGAAPPADPAIAYFNTNELWVMNSDGTNRTRLASAPGGVGEPVSASWAPSGSSIVYRSFGVIARVDVGVVNGQVQAGTPIQLRQPPKVWSVAWSPAPVGSPTHGKIAYSQGSATATTRSSIILIPADRPSTEAEEETVYTTADPNNHIWDIAWNAAGTRVAFVQAPAYPAPNDYLLVLDLATQAVDTVAQFAKGFRGLSWARTQDKLAFSAPMQLSGKCCTNTVVTLDLATGTLTKLVAGFFPVWSPADDKLAFDKPSGPVSTYTFATRATTTLAQGAKADWRR